MSRARKHEVYSWRLSPKLKAELETAASDEKTSVDTILDRLVREWLVGRVGDARDDDQQDMMRHLGLMEGPSRYRSGRKSGKREDGAERQRLLHERARRVMGTVSVGGPSGTNAEVRKVMGEFLEAKHRASQRRAPRRAG